MDQLTTGDRELLEQTLRVPLDNLTEQDIAILRARRSYLTGAQLETYKSVLNSEGESQADTKDTQEQTSTQTEYTDPNAETTETTTDESTETPAQETSESTESQTESIDQATTAENPYDVDPNQLA